MAAMTTDTTTSAAWLQQARTLADDRPHSSNDDLYDWSLTAADVIHNLCDRIEELEAQPAAQQPVRKPLTDEQIDDLCGEANRGFDIERDHYAKAVRDAERAHGIKGGRYGQ